MNNLDKLTPTKIVKELDKYIISQDKAKRSVAIALRNRWRRLKVKGELQQEIVPNNIILIGPTGVGKTEIARRIANLTNAPFVKVEASKFTEVGYVGRDVESMVRELMDVAVNDVRYEMTVKVQKQALLNAKEKVLDLLVPLPKSDYTNIEDTDTYKEQQERQQRTREKMRVMLESKKLDDRELEITLEQPRAPHIEVLSNIGMDNVDLNLGEIFGSFFPAKGESQKKKMKVPEAIKYLASIEQHRLVKMDIVISEAKLRVENNGIIFIDEIDKIATSDKKPGIDVSRSGVQRDLLPIVEGSNVPTKYGMINTRHILFIAAGAFNTAKPSDLIPELQGRFPLREELKSLSKDDFIKILQFPKNSLIKQYTALFNAEKAVLEFNQEAIEEIAEFATKANEKMEDIGARRLHTIMTTLLEEYLFDLPEKKISKIIIDGKAVREKLNKIIEDEDLAKYIL
ncbi:MAG: ATP-dependent protease ATPase subunit HslU [Candidatus Cloacimonetes bacterium]|nr:ATP-dependent protease ATPase subunit HslU [Candidatus Cloacimonadota bacterium]